MIERLLTLPSKRGGVDTFILAQTRLKGDCRRLNYCENASVPVTTGCGALAHPPAVLFEVKKGRLLRLRKGLPPRPAKPEKSRQR
jgi:hypothetical protein